ncbi:venom carboxylesterase-6-like [Bradysia coprophila]|uniref:venom carboxylesterase-6-like n=1 Tax=Bradysia coprophila TaxID=38358 RepID=UPI00187D7DC4|nr:venom carboxylesterase-6-like [Bradysia coprophila]
MFSFVYVLLIFSLQLFNVRSNIIRKTTSGDVKGIEQTSSLGQKYYAFRSVPYAEVPITGIDPYTGHKVDRRFKAPEPLTQRNWLSPLHVMDFKESCLESTNLIPTAQKTGEDCLYLNIYIPAGGAEKKPVLFWVHGGGFTEGGHREALYGPDFLLAEDVVVVAVQYRLGIFGFLNLGEGNYTGNMGLKDQQLALKWVYFNIENFSGNKREILLFGESAGGASTTFHMLNKESRKYFTRAMVMSGSVYSYFAFTATNHREKFGECSHTKDVNQMIEYMKTADARDIVQCYYRPDWGLTLKPEWVPTIEPEGTVNAMLTESPNIIWTSEKAPVVDTLFTMVNQEQVTFDPSLLTRTDPLITADGESSIRLPFDLLDATTFPDEYKKALKELRGAYYSGGTDPNTIMKENIALMSDLNFNYSVLKSVKLQAFANGDQRNTFFLRFGMNDKLNWIQHLHKQKHMGAAHAEELCYIFHCHMLDKDKVYDEVLSKNSSDTYKLIQRLVKTVTNFARKGDPSIEPNNPYRRIRHSNKIFVHELTNEPKIAIYYNIVKELKYDTWREIEDRHANLQFLERALNNEDTWLP